MHNIFMELFSVNKALLKGVDKCVYLTHVLKCNLVKIWWWCTAKHIACYWCNEIITGRMRIVVNRSLFVLRFAHKPCNWDSNDFLWIIQRCFKRQLRCCHFTVDEPVPLHWRHNDHDGVSNHQPHGCLLNLLFGRKSKKTSKLRVTGLCAGNSPGPVNSPHKGPVTRKMFPFDDVIMPLL